MLCEGGDDLGRPCDEWFQWIEYGRVRVFHREPIGAKYVLIVDNLSRIKISFLESYGQRRMHDILPPHTSPGPGSATYNASKLSPRLGLLSSFWAIKFVIPRTVNQWMNASQVAMTGSVSAQVPHSFANIPSAEKWNTLHGAVSTRCAKGCQGNVGSTY